MAGKKAMRPQDRRAAERREREGKEAKKMREQAKNEIREEEGDEDEDVVMGGSPEVSEEEMEMDSPEVPEGIAVEVTAVGPPAVFQASPQNKEATQTKTSPQNKEATQISPQNIEAQGSVILLSKQSPPSNEAPSPQIKEAQRSKTVIMTGPPPKLNKEHFNCKIFQPTDDLNSKTNGIILSLAQQGRSLDEKYFEKASKTKQLTMVFTRPPPKRALQHATDCSQIQTPVQFDGQLRIRSWWFVALSGTIHRPTLTIAKKINPPVTHELIAWITTKELTKSQVQNPAAVTAIVKAVVAQHGRVDQRSYRYVGKDFVELTVLPNDVDAAVALLRNSGIGNVYFRIKSVAGQTPTQYTTVWLDRKTTNEEAVGILKAQHDLCHGLTIIHGKIGLRVVYQKDVDKVRKGAGKYASAVFGEGLHRLSGAPYSWGNRLRNILLEIGLKSKFIRMDRGDFIIALDKKPESRFVQCGDIVILIEKLETEVKAKETAKPVVVKYREARTSYAAAVKRSLPTTKKPTAEVQVVENNVNSLREKTNETIERLQKEVKDMQVRLDEGMAQITGIVETLVQTTKKNEAANNNMATAITSLIEAVKRIENNLGMNKITTSATNRNNTGQS